MPPLALREDDRRIAKEMTSLINIARQQQGLVPLLLNDRLSQVAKGHADDMLRRAYMSHKTPDGVDVAQRVTRSGVMWCAVAENIAGAPTYYKDGIWVTGYESVSEAHEGLMSSKGHKANILGTFEEVGVGRVNNKDGTLIIVEVFLKR